ncbi:vWA domain-containing protein [Ketobacter sp.]|uniref:vWA domain-containing protein n=1 Tax=Ketobacter sp. TaxID=2083498 RepID=UPI000F17D4C1|nr:VWA domain-containing protein [Ketobacter sp.]RLU01107.1 MAG: VWA domain-containing protein [Ketobacter sp.]
MDRVMVDFVKALRGNGVRIATSETLDAMHALQAVGYRDRRRLKTALGVTLAKTEEEKSRFDACFDQFFQFNDFEQFEDNQKPEPPPASLLQSLLNPTPQPGAEPQSELGQLLLQGSPQDIAQSMAQAASAANVRDIRVITQKGLYGRRMMMAMGLEALEQEMWAAETAEDPSQAALGQQLRQARERLREEVKHYVERQYLLQASGDSRALRESVMRETRLENLREFKDVQSLVRKLAKRLVATHSRRRKVYQRGKLDVRSTIRHNIPYSGVLLETHWKTKRVDKPKVMAICDVSGSVSQYSRFLLMFLYSLTEVISNVRAFAFSSDLMEVTDWFERENLDTAIDLTLDRLGGGSTDYGRSLDTFTTLCLNQVDHRTTVIMLGDARNNYGDPRTDLLQAVHNRARQLIWLNPESRLRWGSGDSEMKRYQPYCTWAEPCQSLNQLERFISNLLRYSQ